MNKTIFFNTSLPRAGSTLLQNIMAQNPSIYSTPTSGMSPFILEIQKAFSNNTDFKNEKDYKLIKKAFLQFCKGGINSFYNTLTPKPFILDKNKFWLDQQNFLKQLYPNFKMICLVRDLRSIISSFEKLYRTNINAPFGLYNIENSISFKIDDRVTHYFTHFPLEPPLSRLQELIEIDNLDHILFIKFEDLCLAPNDIINNIYDFLEIPNYKFHNFNKIEQATWENDNDIILGSHSINSSLTFPSPDYNKILGKNISEKIYHNFEWYFKFFNYNK